MRCIQHDLQLIPDASNLNGKSIVDVGCGTGELVRSLTAEGAHVIGVDCNDIVEKALKIKRVAEETYRPGGGEKLPVQDNYADLITFMASFHHVPQNALEQAIEEVVRVLKQDGHVLFLEPVATEHSYTDLIRLVEDEREIQKRASEAIKRAGSSGPLIPVNEEFVYFERSFRDFCDLLDHYVADDTKRKGIIEEAKMITLRLCGKAGQDIESYRFKSICRLNLLRSGSH